jgi:hypothetical protein
MARSTIFGYTVETDEGKLVITLTGSMAQTLVERYSSDGLTQNPRLLQSLLPFGHLGSQSVYVRPHAPSRERPSADQLDLKEIFGQGFDRSRAEFESQLEEYKSLLTPADPGVKSSNVTNSSPRKRARRRK